MTMIEVHGTIDKLRNMRGDFCVGKRGREAPKKIPTKRHARESETNIGIVMNSHTTCCIRVHSTGTRRNIWLAKRSESS